MKCEFKRIIINDGNVLEQLESIKKRITEKVIEYKKLNKFNDWLEPRKLDIHTAKREFKNTLFVKIKGEIHPEKLMARQTGYWRIAKDKQSKINQVVVVHNSVVSRIFRKIQWQAWSENSKKVGYIGDEIIADEIVGANIENWNWQQTVSYSNDVY